MAHRIVYRFYENKVIILVSLSEMEEHGLVLHCGFKCCVSRNVKLRLKMPRIMTDNRKYCRVWSYCKKGRREKCYFVSFLVKKTFGNILTVFDGKFHWRKVWSHKVRENIEISHPFFLRGVIFLGINSFMKKVMNLRWPYYYNLEFSFAIVVPEKIFMNLKRARRCNEA